MARSVEERLGYDADDELFRLLEAFRKREIILWDAGLDGHFRVARAKPRDFLNHSSVLLLSIGGTNAKMLLGAMRDGTVLVERAKAVPNPAESTDFFDFLDRLFLEEPVVRDYLRHHPDPWLGLSIAVGIDQGTPCHPTKIPTLRGLVARDIETERETHHLGNNLKKWFMARGLRDIPTVYQGDGIIAHLGGVAMTPLDAADKSVLMVCGSGLATADEKHFVLCATRRLVEGDPDLFPPDEMEGGQYQYLIAGKGLFGMMRRAVEFKRREPGSALAPHDLACFFSGPEDTRRVIEIWESGLAGGVEQAAAREVRAAVDDKAWEELLRLSDCVVGRGISVLANCALATIAWMGRSGSGRGHRLFAEGSVLLNPRVLPRVREEIRRRRESPRFREAGFEPPLEPEFLDDVRRLEAAPGVSREEANRVDLTLVGAMAMTVAESLLRRE
jgi:hypothetical protein